MDKVIAVFKLLVFITPYLIDAMKTVEAALPGSGNGQSKLALVRSMVEGVFETVNDLTIKFDDAWPAINKVITATVAAFNASGVFKK